MKSSVSTLLAALLALSGCHHRAAAPTAATANSRGIVVSQARLVLPAVKGNPGAGYFTRANDSDVAATLVGVDIQGAQKTEMHETSGGAMHALAPVDIAPGQRLIFAPSGKHVMAFGLSPALTPGGSGVIVFHFRDGKATSAGLRIEAAGGMPDSMPGMDMGGHASQD